MIRGVNLGGWLVLEKWMRIELFDGLKALDETSFCEELGDKAIDRLTPHRDEFITEKDFKWIKDNGLNLVRIPIGHWIFGDRPPFVGCIEYLDKAFDWALKYELNVLIDMHAAKGCQNGFDNGGIQGTKTWDYHQENVDDTVDVIEKLAKRYADHSALWGIQLMNEPRWDINLKVLQDYYKRGYEVIRKAAGDNVCVVFHDAFLPILDLSQDSIGNTPKLSFMDNSKLKDIKVWEGFMKDGYTNIMMDTHHYQCHAPFHQVMDFDDHSNLLEARAANMEAMNKEYPLMVGEWSLGIGRDATKGLSDSDKNDVIKTYAAKQLEIYEQRDAWVFWNYRLSDERETVMPHWSYRKCVEKGWIPDNY